jgi:hypothetical protein
VAREAERHRNGAEDQPEQGGGGWDGGAGQEEEADRGGGCTRMARVCSRGL